jgi:hypothetical protein
MTDISWTKYGIDDTHLWSMDARHARWINASLRLLKPQTVVEVGSHFGISTLAILEAGPFDVHIIDQKITDSVRVMAGDFAATLYEEKSETALLKIPHSENLAVLLDGDHSTEVLQLEMRLVEKMRPRVIIAHDVTSPLIGIGCDGCAWLWSYLQMSGWLCYVDSVIRPGERTSRGLLIATNDPRDHAAVVQAWSQVNA